MREGIRQRLIADVPEIDGRVLERHEDGAAADKPYIVVVQGADAGTHDWAGFGRTFEVWPYEAPAAGFASVDSLCDAVVAALDGRTVADSATGEVFTCRYEGTVGADAEDETRDALTRGLRFSIAAIEPVELAETQPGDAWTIALAAWTGDLLGEDWHAYTGSWPSDYAKPAVLWRVVGLETAEGNAAAVKIRKQLTGHVLGRTPNEQGDAVVRIAEGLKLDGKIPLSAALKQYITVQEVAAMTESDAFSYGQLAVTLMRRSARAEVGEATETPLMREIRYERQVH